jgi:threonine dehydrogenase-like Zn-dependent dehydrogenase
VKAVVFYEPGRVEVEERPNPKIEAPGDAIVKVSLAPVCGSDIVAYRGRGAPRQATIAGHEMVGIVSEVGEGVTRLQPGQTSREPVLSVVRWLLLLQERAAQRLRTSAVFGLKCRVRKPSTWAYPTRSGAGAAARRLSDEKAAFLPHILTGVYAGLQLAGVKAGDSVAIVGCGSTGLATILLAKAMGAGRIFALDHHNYRLAVAEQLGATPLGEDANSALLTATGGRGADVAVEAVGRVDALARALDLTRQWGALLSLSLGMEEEASFPIGRLVQKKVRLLPAYAPAVKNYMPQVINMLAKASWPFPLGHTLALEEAPRAFEMAGRDDGC